MKVFEQLSKQEQTKAVKASLCWIITQIVDGVLDVELVSTYNKTRLKRIMDERWKNEAPRLAMLRLMSDKSICKELMRFAVIDAEESRYDKFGSHIRGDVLQ